MGYQWRIIFTYWPDYLVALRTSITLTILAFALALVLATVAAVARNSKNPILRLIAGVYVEAIRNTPVLLQIFVIYFALPSVGIKLNAYVAGVVALGVNVGAYLAETFRAGINDVAIGQVEAATVLGLGKATVFFRVVFPQALRKVHPTTVNYLIITWLGTSLLSALGLDELTGTGLVINARTLLYVQIFLVLLVTYLIVTFVLSFLGSLVGRVAFKPPLPKLGTGTTLLTTIRTFFFWRKGAEK